MKLLVLLIAMAMPAMAQQYNLTNYSTGAVTIAGASVTNTVAFNRVSIRPQTGVALMFKLTGTSNVINSNVVINGAVSLDNTNWANSPVGAQLTFTFPGPGNGTSNYFTNISAAQLGNARFFTITNIFSSHTNGTLTLSNAQANTWVQQY